MVVIRLSRHGAKKKPFYKINVADQRFKRNGRYIEKIGFFNPVSKGAEIPVELDMERYDYWINKGAQPTDTVKQIAHKRRVEVAENNS